MKNIYVIAGPNGSGKTTFAMKFLPGYAKCPNFINADLIAGGLAPFDQRRAAIQAGRLVLSQIGAYVEQDADFAFETTLSGKTYVKLFKEIKKRGYAIHMFFLWIPSADLAIARIKERVAEGGHNVPAEDVRRRFDRGISNFFNVYEKMLDTWMLFDNSNTELVLIAKRKNGRQEIIRNDLFQDVLKTGGNK